MTGMTPFDATALDSLTRYRDRAGDRADLDDVLDDVLTGTLATVVDGLPWAVPMLFARDGDRILMHGSTGAGALRHVADGAPVALAVHSIDGLVLASSTFDHSAQYRSAVVRGRLSQITGEEAWSALDTITERVVPGRTAEVRPTVGKEVAATTVLTLPIIDGQWLVKVRPGGVGETESDDEVWRGVVPLALAAGTPVAAPGVQVPVPQSVRDLLAAYPAPA